LFSVNLGVKTFQTGGKYSSPNLPYQDADSSLADLYFSNLSYFLDEWIADFHYRKWSSYDLRPFADFNYRIADRRQLGYMQQANDPGPFQVITIFAYYQKRS